jgi:hypothetical protein
MIYITAGDSAALRRGEEGAVETSENDVTKHTMPKTLVYILYSTLRTRHILHMIYIMGASAARRIIQYLLNTIMSSMSHVSYDMTHRSYSTY